jgi:hypothetical protein
MKQECRQWFRNNSFLFPIYLRHILRITDTRNPNAQTELLITGYARSANTFSFQLLNSAFPHARLASHGHTRAFIKVALKHHTPIIILIRSPESCIASLLVKRHQIDSPKRAERYFQDYIDFHTFVLAHIKDMRVLPFTNVINEPALLIREAALLLGETLSPSQIEDRLKAGLVAIHKRDATRPTEGSHLPNTARTAQTTAIKECLLRHPLFPHALELYTEISASASTMQATHQ